jgi:hypothetical protein
MLPVKGGLFDAFKTTKAVSGNFPSGIKDNSHFQIFVYDCNTYAK